MAEGKSDASGVAPGHYVVGELLGVELGNEYTKRQGPNAGQKGQDAHVDVLINRAVVRVTYRDAHKAHEAVGPAQPRDTVRLAVYPRIYQREKDGVAVGAAMLFFDGR